jgi:hypothetical protein
VVERAPAGTKDWGRTILILWTRKKAQEKILAMRRAFGFQVFKYRIVKYIPADWE